jgi:cell division GTPase FtsZ
MLRNVDELTEAERALVVFTSRRHRPSKEVRDEMAALRKAAHIMKERLWGNTRVYFGGRYE